MSTGKLASIAVPALIAVAGMAVAFLATSSGAIDAADGASVQSAPGPTPYSADHARVQAGPGAAAEQPPTF